MIEWLVVLFFVCFICFILTAIIVLRERSLIKKELRNGLLSNYHDIFKDSLFERSYNSDLVQRKFFDKGDWPEVNSSSLLRKLKYQRHLNRLSLTLFAFSVALFIAIPLLDYALNS